MCEIIGQSRTFSLLLMSLTETLRFAYKYFTNYIKSLISYYLYPDFSDVLGVYGLSPYLSAGFTVVSDIRHRTLESQWLPLQSGCLVCPQLSFGRPLLTAKFTPSGPVPSFLRGVVPSSG